MSKVETTRQHRFEELLARVTRPAQYEPDVEALIELTALLPHTDGEPLESPWHLYGIHLLLDSVNHHWRGREDYFAGGNMFVYYDIHRLKSQNFRGPDFFVALGVDRRKPRDKWAVWDEDGHYPDVIVELLSPSTAEIDRTTKKDIYANTFRTPEYYCYDRNESRLEGWRMTNEGYVPLQPNDRGWLQSKKLGVWLGTWAGTYHGLQAVWPRLYTNEGVLIPTPTEYEAARAADARQQLAVERDRADEAVQQATETSERVKALEQEVSRLREMLERLTSQGGTA